MQLYELIQKYTDILLSKTPPFSTMPKAETVGTGKIRYEKDGEEAYTALFPVEIVLEISLDEIVGFKLEKFCSKLYTVCESNVSQIHKGFFSQLNKVITFTGNEIDAKGKGISPELIMDALEKIEIDFDSEGNPKLPQLVVPPLLAEKIKEMEQNEEHTKRFDAIISKKREEYFAKKCYRKLSRVSY